jgi:hypothetical protein
VVLLEVDLGRVRQYRENSRLFKKYRAGAADNITSHRADGRPIRRLFILSYGLEPD